LFAVLERQTVAYDAFGRAVAARLLDAGGGTLALAQTSYDALGRAHCTELL
jgi:hypothetical protein